MPIDISVVVPFFNPGANIEDCLASLVDQTLEPQRFETILVDDGSTDGSDRRVQRWIDRHPGRFTMQRIEASGGPARPRNHGIDLSRGRYIQFLDSDDTLPPRTLERQLEVADGSDADVVVGKLASDFRGVWQPLFRETVTHRTLADYPLIQNLTVCKMFRREFLAAHGVRFPEGPHYIEDQQICIQAYAHATSVAVVADTPCYLYRRRRVGGRNFGDTTIDPAKYFRELAAIFDVIDTQVEPAARESSLLRYYRGEMLGRLRGTAMLDYEPDYRRRMYDEVLALTKSRIPGRVHDTLPLFTRVQSRLLLDENLDGLLDFARWIEDFRLTAHAKSAGWQDGQLLIDLEAFYRHGDQPLRLEADGDGWLLPAVAAPGVDSATRRFDVADTADLDLATISRIDAAVWSTTTGMTLTVDADGVPRVRGQVAVDPATVMGGRRLTGGLWDLRLRVMAGGLTRTSPLRAPEPDPLRPAAWVDSSGSVDPYWTESTDTLALDVDEWMHPLRDRISGDGAHFDGRHQLVVPAPELLGPPGATRTAGLVLIPAETSDEATVGCDAELTVDLDGSTITAALPGLPKTTARWEAWLRLGPLGGSRPMTLPFVVRPGRLGRLTVDTATDDEPGE